MELPHIGDHCAHPGCNLLDYLPFTCNLCNNKYCQDHHKLEDHSCPERYKVDVRVPVCPLCEKPVPSKKGLAPDLAVNEHLENNCQSKSRKIHNNRCSVTGCKVKELVPIQCNECKMNYCLRHRHTTDHDCKGPVAVRRERTLNGSIFKNWFSGSSSTSSNPVKKVNNTPKVENTSRVNEISTVTRRNMDISPSVREANVSTFQGNLSEEDALRLAILESQGNGGTSQSTENATTSDEQLAIALSLEEQNSLSRNRSLEEQNSLSRNRNKESLDCSVS